MRQRPDRLSVLRESHAPVHQKKNVVVKDYFVSNKPDVPRSFEWPITVLVFSSSTYWMLVSMHQSNEANNSKLSLFFSNLPAPKRRSNRIPEYWTTEMGGVTIFQSPRAPSREDSQTRSADPREWILKRKPAPTATRATCAPLRPSPHRENIFCSPSDPSKKSAGPARPVERERSLHLSCVLRRAWVLKIIKYWNYWIDEIIKKYGGKRVTIRFS